MKTRRLTSTITRRRFLTQTLRGIAGLSAVAFLGMKVPEVRRDPMELAVEAFAESLKTLLTPRKVNWLALNEAEGGYYEPQHRTSRYEPITPCEWIPPTRGQG